jgi:hypothetical protein
VSYVQLAKRSYELLRQKPDAPVVFDFALEPHEQIVGVHNYWTQESRSRKTVDRYIAVWVACTFEPVGEKS